MTFGEWLKWFGNLFVKEILTYFIDPASRFILIVPLIIQIFLFGYTATFDLNHAPIAVLNESHGKYSQQLVAQVCQTTNSSTPQTTRIRTQGLN